MNVEVEEEIFEFGALLGIADRLATTLANEVSDAIPRTKAARLAVELQVYTGRLITDYDELRDKLGVPPEER